MEESRLLVKGSTPPPLDREFTVIGKPINRRDAVDKVKGKAKYAGDIKLPGMLYGKTLHCPYPRARITKLDTSRAEKLPGVKAVLSKENTQGWRTSCREGEGKYALEGDICYDLNDVKDFDNTWKVGISTGTGAMAYSY